MGELIPTVFSNGTGTFLRLEYFDGENLVDRITIKIDRMDEEAVKQFFIKYNKQ